MQYFQFNSEGNMFVYSPGSEFSGECKLVRPGDELFINEQLPCLGDLKEDGFSCDVTSSSFVECNNFEPVVKLEELSHKNFSPETMKKVKWAVKMYHEWRVFREENGYEFVPCDLDNKETITKESFTFAVLFHY